MPDSSTEPSSRFNSIVSTSTKPSTVWFTNPAQSTAIGDEDATPTYITTANVERKTRIIQSTIKSVQDLVTLQSTDEFDTTSPNIDDKPQEPDVIATSAASTFDEDVAESSATIGSTTDRDPTYGLSTLEYNTWEMEQNESTSFNGSLNIIYYLTN